MGNNVAALVRLMLVTDDSLIAGRDLLDVARVAARGGITCMQLRLKLATPRDQAAAARALVAALSIPVLVNDRPDIALASGAAGVHLGPGDLPVHLTRRVVPASFIIGASAGSEPEALMAAGADYWGVGPWRATATKRDAGNALGPAGFTRIAALAGDKPCIGIGAVRPEDAGAIVRAGGVGVAVASGILGASDVETAARQYRTAIDAALSSG